MILILQPDTDKSSADYRQLMEYLSNLENITTRTHDEVGARQVLTEIYLVGDTAALQVEDTGGVYLVPAFVGLGAPHWDSQARGAIFGITRGTGPNDIARAALEAVCYQTLDLLEAMEADYSGSSNAALRVDGGMVASDWTMQCLADILDRPVNRPEVLETTALGAAWLAGMHTGIWPDEQGFATAWRLDTCFEPAMDPDTRQQLISGWRDAIRRTLS